MTIHDFREQLAFSHELANAPWWEEVYRKAFPDFATMVDLRHDGWHQLAGRDRAVVLTSGKTVYVDEKGRKETWPDILVEVWSQYPRSLVREGPPYPEVVGAKPGWATAPKDTDWLAYAFVPTRRCHLIPMLGLRAAWVAKGHVWQRLATAGQQGFGWRLAPNPSYVTVNIAVPTDVLYQAIRNAMTVDWTVESTEESWPTVAVPGGG